MSLETNVSTLPGKPENKVWSNTHLVKQCFKKYFSVWGVGGGYSCCFKNEQTVTVKSLEGYDRIIDILTFLTVTRLRFAHQNEIVLPQ